MGVHLPRLCVSDVDCHRGLFKKKKLGHAVTVAGLFFWGGAAVDLVPPATLIRWRIKRFSCCCSLIIRGYHFTCRTPAATLNIATHAYVILACWLFSSSWTAHDDVGRAYTVYVWDVLTSYVVCDWSEFPCVLGRQYVSAPRSVDSSSTSTD